MGKSGIHTHNYFFSSNIFAGVRYINPRERIDNLINDWNTEGCFLFCRITFVYCNRDESQPMEVPDDSAEKPSGWLDDEEPLMPDPDAEKPEDWDDEMDGDWEAPLIGEIIQWTLSLNCGCHLYL